MSSVGTRFKPVAKCAYKRHKYTKQVHSNGIDLCVGSVYAVKLLACLA